MSESRVREICLPDSNVALALEVIPGIDSADYIRTNLLMLLEHFAETNRSMLTSLNESTRALSGLMELRRALIGLASVGYPFGDHIKAIDAGLDRLQHTGRSQILRAYVCSRDPDEIASFSETLSDCITADPNWDWESEFDEALEELEQGRRDARAFA